MYVRVAVNVPTVTGVFDYEVPPVLEAKIQAGSLVIVPFGKQTVQGIVISEVEIPAVEETKEIMDLLDIQPALTSAQVELAKWISQTTLNPLAVCLDAMLPPGISQHADTCYTLAEFLSDEKKPLEGLEKRLLDMLKRRGSLRGRQISRAMPKIDWKPAASRLVEKGWLTTVPILPPPTVRPRYVRTAMLSATPDEIEKRKDELGRGAASERRLAVLEFLKHEPLPVLVNWISASCNSRLDDLTYLAELDLVQLGETEIFRDPLERYEYSPQEPVSLTHSQQQVWHAITSLLQITLAGKTVKPCMLYGVTGSGKTELYLRAVEQAIQAGKQALVLVPEISLTPQTVQRFAGRFPGQVGLIHSKLSEGERYDTWRRARSGMLKIIVGPRSALFTPLPDLGLIVIDECHEEHYYQRDIPPTYSAVEAGLHYASQTNSLIILGSATPDVAMYWRAQHESWNILTLPERVLAHRKAIEKHSLQMGKQPAKYKIEGDSASLPLPPVTIVDMREELKAGNTSIFSGALHSALEEVLTANQQAILFLNRRGSATYVFCRKCGYTMRCPRCSFPLTAHEGGRQLVCHTCNYHRHTPTRCPQCDSTAIRQYGSGTEKLEAEVVKQFPQARVLRWDAETTRAKGAHDLIMAHFSNHQADVLVGTQMLTKGLDLPLVTLVGIVLADVGLSFPDYRTDERAFQLLTQVAGRAGRSPLGGQVILQTFQPEQPAIQAAAKYDFSGFYQKEIAQRKRLGYPPFAHLVRMEYRSLHEQKATNEANELAERLKFWIKEGDFSATDLIGPAPCYFTRMNGMYRWQIVLRGPNPVEIIRDRALADWHIEVDPPSLL
ncbi:MAG: primosomal protein N' [Anaerolineaceae bacterium]